MEAEVAIIGTKKQLEDAIPKAVEFSNSEFGIEGNEDHVYLLAKAHAKPLEISESSLGFEIQTEFGNVSIFLTPDRAFYEAVLELAEERVAKALKIIRAGQ
jgi:hypothetical protein